MNLILNKMLISIMIILLLFHKQLESITDIEALGYSDELIILILFICALVKILKRKRINTYVVSLFVYFIVYTITGLISYFVNSSGSLSTIDLLMTTLLETKFMILILALLVLDFTPDIYEHILKILISASYICISVALINLFLPEIYIKVFSWGFIQKRYGIISPCSIFDHPGTYGWYLVLIGSYFYYKWYQKKGTNELSKMLVLLSFGILSMKSKVFVAVLVMFATPLIFGKIKRLKTKKIIISVSVIIILAAFFGESIWERVLLSFSSKYSETEARAALNVNSLKLFANYFPIGVGFGKYGSWYARIRYSEYYTTLGMNYIYGLSQNFMNFGTDTFWPCILGETGLIGTCAYAGFLIKIFKYLFTFVKSNQNNYMYMFCFFVLLQGIVESFAQSFFFGAPQNVICAFVIAMAFSLNKNNKIHMSS